MTWKRESAILALSKSGSERIRFLFFKIMKEQPNISCCPYCGADVSDGAFSFCSEYGNPLTKSKDQKGQKKRMSRSPKDNPCKKKRSRWVKLPEQRI